MISRSTSAKIANLGIVCAFLVVCIHVKWPTDAGRAADFVTDLLVHHVARYAVPFFFGVSGYLLAGRFGEPGWWRRAVRSRILTLGIPFAVWSGLFLLEMGCADVIANLLAGREPLAEMRGAWGSVRIFMGTNLFHPPGLVPMWYVRNLLLLVAVSPLLKAVTQRVGWWSVGGIALVYVSYGAVAAAGMVPDRWCSFLNYGFSIEGLLCFSVGIVLRRRGCEVLSRVGVGASCVAWLSALVLSLVVEGRVPTCGFAVRLLCMAATVLFAWKAVPGVPWPTWLTASAFPVFVMHCLVLDACRLLPPAAPGAAGACLRAVLELIAACLLPVAFCRITGGLWLQNVLFGGRTCRPGRIPQDKSGEGNAAVR